MGAMFGSDPCMRWMRKAFGSIIFVLGSKDQRISFLITMELTFKRVISALFPLFVFCFLFVDRAQAQDEDEKGDNNIIDKGKIGIKMRKARNQLMQNNRRGAMNTAREVIAIDEDNAKAHFLIARSHYQLGHYSLADKYIKKAAHDKKKVGSEFYLVSGKVYHRQERLDSAIKMFERYKEELEGKTLPKDRRLHASNVDHYIEQCQFAQKMMKDPLDVERENLGRRINSRYGEYAPCASKDGKKLFFTARRSDTKGGGVDQKGDHRYFEDIYFSEWDEEDEEWTRPHGVPGRINTKAHDAIVSLAPNGERMYIGTILNITETSTGLKEASELGNGDGPSYCLSRSTALITKLLSQPREGKRKLFSSVSEKEGMAVGIFTCQRKRGIASGVSLRISALGSIRIGMKSSSMFAPMEKPFFLPRTAIRVWEAMTSSSRRRWMGNGPSPRI